MLHYAGSGWAQRISARRRSGRYFHGESGRGRIAAVKSDGVGRGRAGDSGGSAASHRNGLIESDQRGKCDGRSSSAPSGQCERIGIRRDGEIRRLPRESDLLRGMPVCVVRDGNAACTQPVTSWGKRQSVRTAVEWRDKVLRARSAIGCRQREVAGNNGGSAQNEIVAALIHHAKTLRRTGDTNLFCRKGQGVGGRRCDSRQCNISHAIISAISDI